MSYADRMAARREKERKVLAFLRREIWTTPKVLAILLQSDGRVPDRSMVSRLVWSLHRAGLVETETLDDQRLVVGITADGQVRAAELLQKDLVMREYERGRVSMSMFQHREDLQLLHISCARAGWSVFRYPDRRPAPALAMAGHRPDAVTRAPAGQTVAIECERTIKTQKRYAAIIGGHLSNICADRYQHVIYACPDKPRAQAVEKIFSQIDRVVVQGKDKSLTSDDREKFSFLTYQEVPQWPS